MSPLYFKLVPLVVACCLFAFAFRVHERFWSLGFSGWKKIYLGLAAVFFGSLAGVFFEFSELRNWQETLGLPVDWMLLGLFASLGTASILWGAVERLSLAAQEKDDLEDRKEAFELFDDIRDAAQGPHSFLEILNFSLKEILRRIDADAGGIWLIHPSGNDYILASASGFALSLQQKLEKVSVGHLGFSRVMDAHTAREITDPATLRRWFPELCSFDNGYGSLIGVPLTGGYGQARQREPLGLLLFCSRNTGLQRLADMKLIGSAVAFLAATIAEVRASRLLRNQRRDVERSRIAAREFSAWVQEWSAEEGEHHRLQTAISRLAEHTGDFVGCGRYLLKENRWEPLALAAAVSNEFLLGQEGFRRTAAEAIEAGKEITYELPATERQEGKTQSYRMHPVANPVSADGDSAVLFLPNARNIPEWWELAVVALVELTKVVLAVETARPEKPAIAAAPEPQQAFDWANLSCLIERRLREKPGELPGLLAGVLPMGWRVALWQSPPGNRSEYRLRLAAAKERDTTYYQVEELTSAPLADQIEIDAHLGGLVRVEYKDTGALTELWPDFGAGWIAHRFGSPFALTNWGWVTFYQKTDSPEADEHEMNFLRYLAGLMELITYRLDETGETPLEEVQSDIQRTGESSIDGMADIVPDDTVAGSAPLDRAITTWIASQSERVRPGRIDFSTPPSSTPLVDEQAINEILNWGAANLQNGLPEQGYVMVSVNNDNDRFSIVFDRTSPPDLDINLNSLQPAALEPVRPSVRETLETWHAKSRIINSSFGPRKLILSFSPGANDTSAKNILIIDEEELIRDLLLGMLEVLGYEAAATTSVEEGFNRFLTGDFDTIITGQGLIEDETDGLAQRVKLHRPQTRIVLVRELGLADVVGPSSHLIDATLAKPFRIDDLKAILETPTPTPSQP